MNTRLADLDDVGDFAYLRHTRCEMLRALGMPTDGRHDPLPFALYVIANDDDGTRIGMCESALLHAAYRSIDDVPYRTLVRHEPFEHLSSIRSIWVEPQHRGGPAFAMLYQRACRILFDLGARLAVFSAAAPALVRLYERQHAHQLGRYREPVSGAELTMLGLDLAEVCARPNELR